MLGVVSCGAGNDSGAGETLGQSRARLTDVVRTSEDCAYDAVSGGCFGVPPKPVDCRQQPVLCNASLDGSVDGVKSPHEYDGATVLPYTDQRYKSESKVYVRAYKEFGHRVVGGGGAPTGHLKVFFENMPVIHEYGSTVGSGHGTPNPFYVVFIDHDRFTGTDASIDSRDDFFLIDITGTLPATRFRRQADGSFKVVGKADYHAAKNCTQESAFLWRCNGELRIPLPASDLAAFPAPNENVEPGIGFAVYPYNPIDLTVLGGLPEHKVATTSLAGLLNDRTKAISLLFGKPKGFEADFMTWNVRRSTVDPLAGDFKKVADSTVGDFIGSASSEKSIIALQELWDKGKRKSVFKAMNDTRAQQGLSPLYWEGPPDFGGSLIHKAIQTIAGVFIGNDGTNGGVYTLSARPIVDHAYMTFENKNCTDCCKGEDCFKGKGVLWTRILLNPPTPAKNQCVIQYATNPPQTNGAAPPCDQPPGGDEYVDVFNTHLNATNPEVCSGGTELTLIIVNILAMEAVPGADLLGWYLLGIQQGDLHCNTSDRVIQERELDEMNAFIDKHASPDRPSIIMGDFNIDGRQLGAADSMYREVLKRLHIGPVDPKALPFVNNSNYLNADDLVNPWPFDNDWDVDHGDLARQRFATFGTTYPTDGECMGTYVGGSSLTATNYSTATCTFADRADGQHRFDYVFVRPPKQSDDPEFKAADWVAEKDDQKAWSSPYPGSAPNANGVFSGPPDRLSDHKPVTVGLSFAKLVVPPSFHPDWKHQVEFRVSAVDASNRDDCTGCGTVDPKVAKYYGHVPLGSNNLVFDGQGAAGNFSHYCKNQPSASWPADGCMDNWSSPTATHDGQEKQQFFGAGLFDDDDDPNPDDPLKLNNQGTWPVMWVSWSNPASVYLTGWLGGNLGTKVWVPTTSSDFPIPTSTTAYPGPTDMVMLFTATELPPDQQF